MTLQSRIEVAISSSTHQQAEFVDSKTAYGGCINDSCIVTLKDGRQYFVKTHPQAKIFPGLFETEFEALQLLVAPEVINVPKPITCGNDFIVMNVFKEGTPAKDWQEQMGRCLAQLHLATKKNQFGLVVIIILAQQNN